MEHEGSLEQRMSEGKRTLYHRMSDNSIPQVLKLGSLEHGMSDGEGTLCHRMSELGGTLVQNILGLE